MTVFCDTDEDLKLRGLLIMTVNGTGAVLQAIKYLKLVGILDVGCLALVILVVLLAFQGNFRIAVVEIFCAVVTLGMYASPLFIMRTVIKTRSVEYMPFFLSFFLFLDGGIWTFYAILVKDLIVFGVPNAIGFMLGSLQLILYFVYKTKSRSKKSTVKMKEEGSAHLVKSSVDISENKVKTHLLTPYELQCYTNRTHEEEDVEAALGEPNTTHQA